MRTPRSIAAVAALVLASIVGAGSAAVASNADGVVQPGDPMGASGTCTAGPVVGTIVFTPVHCGSNAVRDGSGRVVDRVERSSWSQIVDGQSVSTLTFDFGLDTRSSAIATPASPNISVRDGADIGVLGVAEPAVGMIVFKSGQVSGVSSGVVTGLGDLTYVQGMQMCHGDSGAPVYTMVGGVAYVVGMATNGNGGQNNDGTQAPNGTCGNAFAPGSPALLAGFRPIDRMCESAGLAGCVSEARQYRCEGRPANLLGTDGDDFLVGTDGDDVVAARPGNDFVVTGPGHDLICGDQGDDAIFGQDGNDIVFGGDGNDAIFGWFGSDTLLGGNGDDTIFGEQDNDTLIGEGGDDALFGQDGRDVAYGGDGNDALFGWFGSDTLFGGSGDDALFGEQDDDAVYGEDGNDFVAGQQDNDMLSGGNGDDTLFGFWGNDLAHGDAGNDAIYGEQGDDELFGDSGNDTLYGGDGNDRGDGGADYDICQVQAASDCEG